MFFKIWLWRELFKKWRRSFSEAKRKKREDKALIKSIEESARDAIIMARFSI